MIFVSNEKSSFLNRYRALKDLDYRLKKNKKWTLLFKTKHKKLNLKSMEEIPLAMSCS